MHVIFGLMSLPNKVGIFNKKIIYLLQLIIRLKNSDVCHPLRILDFEFISTATLIYFYHMQSD
jgi:hypothetical protein